MKSGIGTSARTDIQQSLGRAMPAHMLGEGLVDVRRPLVQSDPAAFVDERLRREASQQYDIRIGVHEDVGAQPLCDCELYQLLEQPSSDRAAAGLNPDVRTEPELQRVDATQPEREHVLLRHDLCPAVLERAEQGEVAAIDHDPVLERRRARLQASIEQRAAVEIQSVAGRNKCDRCGQVSIPSSDGSMRGRHSLLGTPALAP